MKKNVYTGYVDLTEHFLLEHIQILFEVGELDDESAECIAYLLHLVAKTPVATRPPTVAAAFLCNTDCMVRPARDVGYRTRDADYEGRDSLRLEHDLD